MGILAERTNPAHPSWCDQAHGEIPVHGAQVGADLELSSELTYGVFLSQAEGEPTEVQLMRHAARETSLAPFSLLEVGILRDLLGEALGLVAREAGLL